MRKIEFVETRHGFSLIQVDEKTPFLKELADNIVKKYRRNSTQIDHVISSLLNVKNSRLCSKTDSLDCYEEHTDLMMQGGEAMKDFNATQLALLDFRNKLHIGGFFEVEYNVIEYLHQVDQKTFYFTYLAKYDYDDTGDGLPF